MGDSEKGDEGEEPNRRKDGGKEERKRKRKREKKKAEEIVEDVSSPKSAPKGCQLLKSLGITLVEAHLHPGA